MYAHGLQLITVSDDKVVLKRGMHELLLKGPAVQTLVEPLVRLLDEGRSKDQILERFPGTVQPEVESLIKTLLDRRLITDHAPTAVPENGSSALQMAFWSNFGEIGEFALGRLESSSVVIVGANAISRHLAQSLVEMKLGRVQVVSDGILDNRIEPFGNGGAAGDRLQGMPDDDWMAEQSVICATCDFGAPEALLELSRLALRVRTPFLPVWLGDMIGYVGPLTYPFETACLRCYQLRTDSNSRAYEAARAVRRHIVADQETRYGVGMLPPMPAVVGHIAAMELVKCLIGFAPADAIGRVIEVNLISFTSAVRRVLKIPRCPDCSTAMQSASRAVTLGPQIPAE